MTSQHDRDSRELRELCAQRDAARATVRQQAERIAELEASLDAELCNRDVIDKMLEQCIAERDLLRAEVIANRERDALKLAALHIHSEMRSIVQAGGSNEAIGREFRKRVILDVEDEVVKLRAEVERLRVDAERYRWLRDNLESEWAICEWQDDPDGLGYYRDARASHIVDAAIDLARTTHKETE